MMDRIKMRDYNAEEKNSNSYYLYFIFFIIIFSNITLRNENYLTIYMAISITICFFFYFIAISNLSKLLSTIFNAFSLWLMFIYFIFFLYGMALTKYSYFNSDYFLLMYVMTFISMFLLIDISNSTLIKIFIKTSVYTSIAVCLYLLINEWSLIISGGTRIGDSGSGNVNTVATYIGIMSIPCAYMMMYERKRAYYIIYPLLVVFMLMTGSKKSYIFIIMGLLLLAIYRNGLKIHKYITPLIMITGLIVLILNNEYLYSIIGSRTLDFLASVGINIEGAGYSTSTIQRLSMYNLAFQAFMENPIFGGGWFYFSAYTGLGTYSHNNFTELLVNYGIVGFAIYYSMHLFVLLRLRKIIQIDNHAKLFFCLIITILINDTAAVTFSTNLLNYLVLLVAYLYVRNYNNTKKPIAETGV